MKFWPFVLVALSGAFYFLGSLHEGDRSGVLSESAWQRMVLPGELSRAHAFLERDCAACHTAVKGGEASKCIACHANNESLLQRQPTAFHANVSSCRECHHEHRGSTLRTTEMDHRALAEIGFRHRTTDHPSAGENEWIREGLLDWVDQHQAIGSEDHSRLTPEEAVLSCASCHSTKDPHFQLLGQDCGQCHATTKWTIPEFRHPSPKSMDCVQCHQAPPSHYMMHFQMISAKFARKPHAEVNQCYECHQTTGWNDIKGAGFYKHH